MKLQKRIISSVLIFVLFLSTNTIIGAEKSFEDKVMDIETRYYEYIKDNLEDIVDVDTFDNSLFRIDRNSNYDNIKIEKPFVIYLLQDTQDPILYYPLSCNNEIVLIVNITETTNGFCYSVSESYSEYLNEIDYLNNNCVFYNCSGVVYIETEEDIINTLTGSNEHANLISKESDYAKLSFNEKEKLSQNIIKDFTAKDVNVITNISTSEYIYKGDLTLYNPQGQHGRGMCWACSCATIINYMFQKSVTGYEVCNRMSIGYDVGGTIYDEQDALYKYGIDYSYTRNTALDKSRILQNINNEKPIIANYAINGATIGHAVTIYGIDSYGRINVWDSNLNNGNGASCLISNSAVYPMDDGYNYYWRQTVSYY